MKNWSIFSSSFRDMENVMPVIFGEMKMSFGYEKRPANIFGKATETHKFG